MGVGRKLGEGWNLDFSARMYDGRREEPGTLESPPQDLVEKYLRGGIDLDLRGHLGHQGYLHVQAYRTMGHHTFTDGWESRDWVNGVWSRLELDWSGLGKTTFGLEGKRFGGRSLGTYPGEWSAGEEAVLLHHRVPLLQRLQVSGGMRLHHDDAFGLEWVPEAGLVWNPGDTLFLRARYTRGFRSPQLNERFIFPSANPDLKPERAWSTDLGADWQVVPGQRLRLGLFDMQGDNLIRLMPNTTGSGPRYRFQNGGTFHHRGAELEWEGYWGRYLRTGTTLTLLDAGEKTAGKSPVTLTQRLSWERGAWTAVLGGRWISRQYQADDHGDPLPPYTVLDLHLRVHLGRSRLSLLVDVENLMNHEYVVYAVFPGGSGGVYPMPGRWLTLGLEWAR